MIEKDLISVVMPVNCIHQYLRPSIQSILLQSYKNIELVIVVSGVSESNYDNLVNIYKYDHRVRIFYSTVNNLSYCLNFGVGISRGNYIARMDSDDISSLNRLEIQYNFMINNKNIKISSGEYNVVNNRGLYLRNVSKNILDKYMKLKIIFTTGIAHPTVMFTKNDFCKLGGYKNDFICEDWDLWLRYLRNGYQIEMIPEILIDYRIHENQLTNKKNFIMYSIYKLLIREFMLTRNPLFIISIIYNFIIFNMIKLKRSLKND